MPKSYYNEFDPFAAAWLRELISAGHIAPGDVDERDIREVVPADLDGYAQCHFFAGIGGWSYALRLAGVPDSAPCWTGSCPCQPFSVAGKGDGHADERHLWPEWFRLIRSVRPPVLFGEQVSAAIRHGWLDLVHDDLEAEGYAVGAVVFPACSVGAFHKRERLYFVAHAASQQDYQEQRRSQAHEGERSTDGLGGYGVAGIVADAEHSLGRPELALDSDPHRRDGPGGSGDTGLMGNSHHPRPQGLLLGRDGTDQRAAGEAGVDDQLAYPLGDQRGQECTDGNGSGEGSRTQGLEQRSGDSGTRWLWCRDQKYRPTQSIPLALADDVPDGMGLVRDESGYYISPLIEKAVNRVGRLRGYGNAIVPTQAAAFIRACND